MSLKKKISILLSVIWIAAWAYISYLYRNFLPILYSSIPLIIIWGINLSFKPKKYNPNIKIKYFRLPDNAFFKDSKKLTTWLKILVCVFIVTNLVASIAYFDPNFFHSDKIILQLIYAFAILICALAIVFWFIVKFLWIYRTTFNAHYLGAAEFPYSPWGAVGWSILTFGLYFVIRSLWKASYNPDIQWKNRRTAWIIKFWGICYILGTIFALLLLNNAYVCLLLVISEILFLFIINSIFKNQVLIYNNHLQAKAYFEEDI